MQSAEKPERDQLPERGRPLAEIVNKRAIACDFCGKTFKYPATLRQHEKIHYGIKQHECELCHRRFLQKFTLKCHQRMHTDEKPYKCPHCSATFRGQTGLNCHIFRHTNVGAKCPVCPKVFATSSIVKQHLKQVHTNERSSVCNLCGVTYKHLKSLRIHLRNHQKRACPECGASFDSVYAMQKHRKHSHAKKNLPYQCEHCDRAFEQRSKLASHEKLRGRPFQCELCCHSFNKQDYLTNHQRRIHWREMGLERLRVAEPQNGWNRKGIPKPKRRKIPSQDIQTEDLYRGDAVIDECDKQSDCSDVKHVSVTKDEPAIAIPIESDRSEPETASEYHEVVFKTEQACLDVPAQQEDLTNEPVHKNDDEYQDNKADAHNPARSPNIQILKARHHQCDPVPKGQQSSKESLICEICGNLYASSAALIYHRVKQHRAGRFQCDQCDRSFGFRCTLQKHIRTHHEHEKMPCKLCDKTFKYPQDLKVHLLHHTDPRPFKCDQCDAVFRFPTALRAHTILHQTEQPFKCGTCGKYFRYANSLRVHERLHTGVKLFRCVVCEREFSTKAPMLRHMKVHERGREMACVVCGMVYYKKVDLEIHQSKVPAAVDLNA